MWPEGGHTLRVGVAEKLAFRTEVRAYRSGVTASTTGLGAPDPTAGWVPVDACTLPTEDRPLRVAEFDHLFSTAQQRQVQPPAPGEPRGRLVLAGDGTLPDRVQQLADAETACCSFFTFTVTPLDPDGAGLSGGSVVALDIEVAAARADVLAALVQRAEQGRRRAA